MLSIGRFYQMATPATDAVLLAELRYIAEVAPTLIAGDDPRVFVDRPCGRWLGRVAPYQAIGATKSTLTVAIRTFA